MITALLFAIRASHSHDRHSAKVKVFPELPDVKVQT